MVDSLITQMQRLVLTTAQVREVDQIAMEEYGMHSLVLMENAAIHCVHWLLGKYSVEAPARTVLLCGKGNNGGDGLAIARHLRAQGWHCTVALCGPPSEISQDAQANWAILTSGDDSGQIEHLGENMVLDLAAPAASGSRILEEIRSADLIVDAMLGTGVRGGLRSPFAAWVEASNHAQGFRLAIDIPTGLGGEVVELPACYFQAHQTLTFVAQKPAMTKASPIRKCFGEIAVLPIGLPPAMMDRLIR